MDFSKYLEFFPEIQLPITLREDTYMDFSADKPPLPIALVDYYILDENEEDDGMTEFIPCFRLPAEENYVALVYWKAGLLNYEYILRTYTKDGAAVIDSSRIAGTLVEGTTITQSIALIAADKMVYIATGAFNEDDDMDFDINKNSTQTIEINDDGTLEL